MQGEEEQLLTQWKTKHQLVDENLCAIEQQLDQFSEPPEDEALLEAAIEENEVFYFIFFIILYIIQLNFVSFGEAMLYLSLDFHPLTAQFKQSHDRHYRGVSKGELMVLQSPLLILGWRNSEKY